MEAMRSGVNDFLIKSRLARLVPVIERELREAEARRRQAAIEAELDRQREEAALLERAREQAQRESDFKSKFLATMSHELRTPLNSVIGFSELLQQDALTLAQREYVDNVLQSGLHLLRLIDDILDLAKIEAGRIELRLERMSIVSCVDAAYAAARALADPRKVRLEFDVPADLPDIDADPVRIKQILYNLLSNGIKFTHAGGSVWLRARREREDLHISVGDTGIGIAPQDLARLFQEFERIEAPTGARTEGTGLGLALTQRLVMLHGGTITVESEVGEGSTFTVSLPISSPEHAGAAS